MTAVVLRGDARRLPLPDGCVDLIVTSPPYFGLRSYTDTCRICLDIRSNGLEPAETIVGYEAHVRGSHHYDGQIGSEATPAEWLAALVGCTAEWVRVLKPSGSIFVNLGDKYAAGHGGSSTEGNGVNLTVRRDRPAAEHWAGKDSHPTNSRAVIVPGTRPKSLLGLPWRYALACMDQLGLILRRDIIWSKPNGLPESVTDRCRSSHEYLFHLVRQPRYYAAVDEIREPHVRQPRPNEILGLPGGGLAGQRQIPGRSDFLGEPSKPSSFHPLGKLPGSVWDIPSQPLTVPARLGVDHFAAFPMELPRRCVLGWSPPGVCTACGEGRRPVSERGPDVMRRPTRHKQYDGPVTTPHGAAGRLDIMPDYRITGYACACPEPGAPVRPALVVDPFGGTGCTALVAAAYGRTGVSVDLSGDYCRLARWRTADPAERARALLVPKPPPVPDGQGSLFDDEAV